MASFAVIVCLACLVSFSVVMGGGKYKRETGWPLVAGMLALASVVEFVIISIVVCITEWAKSRFESLLTRISQAYLYDHDEQFMIPGWNLDASWYLSTVSASICLLAAVCLLISAYILPPEEGYEFLSDPEEP